MNFFYRLLNEGHAQQLEIQNQAASSDQEKVANAISFATQEIMQKINILKTTLKLLSLNQNQDQIIPILTDASSESERILPGFNSAISQLGKNPIVVNSPQLQSQLLETKNKIVELESLVNEARQYL